MPEPEPFRHFVFVDFENVPSVDLAPIHGKPVHVTLLIGEKQKRLHLELVRQIHAFAAQVTLIEVGASGRNALDMVLAAHLGRATVQHPTVSFAIVSNDRDFDPLIAHLSANKIVVSRHHEFSALPFLSSAKRPAGPVARTGTPRIDPRLKAIPSTPRPRATPSADKFEKLVGRLRSEAGPRPKRKDRLLHHIATAFGNQLSDGELQGVADQLARRGVIVIDGDGRVTYGPRPRVAS